MAVPLLNSQRRSCRRRIGGYVEAVFAPPSYTGLSAKALHLVKINLFFPSRVNSLRDAQTFALAASRCACVPLEF